MIKENIYSTLTAQSSLLTLLGPIDAANARIYAAWPQAQPVLTGFEPDEGWLIMHEEQASMPFGPIYEDVYFNFHIFVTRATLADDVIDILDSLWNWRMAGHNSFVYGERNVLFSKRIHINELFEIDTKLYHKIARYLLRMVKTPFTG